MKRNFPANELIVLNETVGGYPNVYPTHPHVPHVARTRMNVLRVHITCDDPLSYLKTMAHLRPDHPPLVAGEVHDPDRAIERPHHNVVVVKAAPCQAVGHILRVPVAFAY